MRVGIPKEIKPKEGRVDLIPAGVGELVEHGHEVYFQAGVASGYADVDYRNVAVRIVEDAATLDSEAQGSGSVRARRLCRDHTANGL